MAKFSKFEEIQAWQKARDVTLEIYRLTTGGEIARDFGLKDQMRRAAVSIMANIAEGTVGGLMPNSQTFLIFPGVRSQKHSRISMLRSD